MGSEILRFLTGLWVICAGAESLAAQTRRDTAASSLQQTLDRWFRATARSAPGEWGIAIADLEGRLLWGVKPTRPMVPASTVKLLTTGFARSILGSDARRSTRVIGAGHLDQASGTWIGTWALEINGDPTLEGSSSQGGTRLTDLATQLAIRGIRRLTGPLALASAAGAADASFPSTWSPRHQGRVFAPLVGNLTIHDNLVSATVTPGARIGRRVAITAVAPQGIDQLFTVTATTLNGRRSRLRVEPQANGGYHIAGTLGIRSRPRRVVRTATDPRAVLEAAWTGALKNAGIEWSPSTGMGGGALASPSVLAEMSSPVFDSIASEVNRRSHNLGAELMLQWAAGYAPDPARRLTAHVEQVTGDYGTVRLVDGSGLSDENRVSPWTFVSYLARFPLAPGGKNFPMLLPANGSGTLWKLTNGLRQRGVVRAKTGTLGNVASIVGYLGRSEGVLLVSLMYNGRRVWAARQAQWRLFRQLGAEGVVIPSDSVDATGQMGGEDR